MGELICRYKWDEKRVKEHRKWLDEKEGRHLVILEDDPQMLFRSLPHRRIHLFVPNSQNEESILQQIAWQFVFSAVSYEGEESALIGKLREIQEEVHYLASDFADRGVQLLPNLKGNGIIPTFSAASLAGKFKGVPAIICGAGPSLAKNGAALTHLSKRALLLAGGAAVEALRHHALSPHFGAHIDPHPTHHLSAVDYPLFFQLRTSHQVTHLASAARLLVKGSGNFPFETWIEEQRGLAGEPLDGGWTVGTFCIALAVQLGCDPIILAGMDFATPVTGCPYAQGVSHSSQRRGKWRIARGDQGQEVYTQGDWLLARNWAEHFAKNHPHLTFIDTTEGGLGFRGMMRKKIDEIELGDIFDGKKKVDEAISSLVPLPPAPLEGIERSLKKAQQLCITLLKKMEEIFPKSPEEEGQCLFLEHELEGEIAVQKILRPIWEIWKHPIERENHDGAYGSYLHRLLFYLNFLG